MITRPHGPYSTLGPVEVAGAQPGDVIECSITRLCTIGWGWNSFPPGVGALPHDFPSPKCTTSGSTTPAP